MVFFKYLPILLFSLAYASAEEDRVEFNRDIRPILSDNCFYCHGFDEKNRKADLRLDTFEGATADGAVVPGKTNESELIARIFSSDPDEIMPPLETEQHLSAEEKDILKRWINQGAEYEEHWAWQKVRRPSVPGDASGAAAIDAFLKAEWEAQGVKPVEQASPRDLLRRLSYDLRGLPPTAEEVAEFESAPDDAVFEKFRDQWISELSYAEHQAVQWLDLVRWADSSGLVSDEPIASGAYRAWIIEAFRDNMPFDEFSTAQLAGDLLPNPTDGQLIASGYNRIVNTNCEAGAIEDEQLYKLKGEHVRAFGTVWMGMTTGCAECHDHKFDPLSARDYYSLAAFFDDLVEAGVYTPGDRREPLHYVHDDQKKRARDQKLSAEIATVKKEIATKELDEMEIWRNEMFAKLKDTKSRTDFVWIPGQLPAPRILEGRFKSALNGESIVRETIAGIGKFHRHHAAELISGYIHPQKTDAQKDAWFVDAWIDPNNRPEMVGIQISQGDYGRLGWKTANYETYYWGKDTSGTLDLPHLWSDPKRVKRIGDLPVDSGWVRLRVPYDQQIKAVPGQAFEAVGMAWLQTGGRVQWGDSGLELRTDKTTALVLGETAIRKWAEVPMNRRTYERRSEFVSSAVRKKDGDRSPLQQEAVADAFRENTQPELMKQLRSLESELFSLRSKALPVLVSRRSDKRRTTRVLNRGDYLDESGPIVAAAVPEFLGDAQGSRLELARWLFSNENPLTARVYVNRLWQQFFGRGISETLEDSGTQGDWPSHLRLLNWLAVEFRESGWDRNHMVRLLTSTQAYKLSSMPPPDLAERDPGNRWHARQGRHRLTAEEIRDSALYAAGLLKETNTIPKQSFFPYQPNAYWDPSSKVMFGSRQMTWETNEDQSQYQRSLYTYWKRQNIHPTMLAFDAPTRQECTAQRNITNTPGQALALLNDPIFVEAARVLAARVGENAAASDAEKIQQMYRTSLQRDARPDELQILTSLLSSQRTAYESQPDKATELTTVGRFPSPASAIETAAWTAVARVVLNLHEFLNRS